VRRGAGYRLPLGMRGGMCQNPQVEIVGPAIAELIADVAAAVTLRLTAVSEDVYEVILREIPELDDDKPVLALLSSSVHSNVETCLQIMQHQIDLSAVQAPAASLAYARRRAQRGTALTALLRAYRVGHALFLDWLLRELAQQTDNARLITGATLGMSQIVAGYVDQTSEEIVAAYARERENWLRNRSAARSARIRDLLSGQRINVTATEATLGYRLRQYHVGLVCWAGDATAGADNVTRLERAIGHVAAHVASSGDPVFLPRDESSAWAWLPLGIRDTFDAAGASAVGVDGDIHFAFGDAARGTAGFRLTHRQAIAAQSVALAAGSPAPRAVAFGEVAPVAMMLGSPDLLRAWVLSTLAGLATDDEHHARLRDTLLVFLQTGGSYKATAERLVLHKNTVQYRIRKAEESIGRPVGGNQHDVELALRASHWLGSSVLQPTRERSAASGALRVRGIGSPRTLPPGFERGTHRQPHDVSQPLRHPDQPAEKNGKNDNVTARRRGKQREEVRAGRLGKLHAGGDHRAVRFGLHLAKPGQQCKHGPVLGEDLGGEVLDPGPESVLAQAREKRGSQAAALPGIDHGHPYLCGIGLLSQADEPALSDDLGRQQRQGDQRLVVDVVDLDRRPQGRVRKLGHDREEPPVAGLLAQVRVRQDQRRRVIRPHLPYPYDVTGAERDKPRSARCGHGQPFFARAEPGNR